MKRSLILFASIILMLSLLLSFSISGCTKTETSTTAAAPTTTTPKPTTTTPAATTTTPVATTTTTKPAPTLSSIVVTPASPDDLKVGSTQRFTATGTYSDGSSRQLFSATWTSDNPSVVKIDSTGLARGLSEGMANITASQAGITSSPVSLKVFAPPPPETTTPPPGEETTAPTGPVFYISVSVDSQLLVAAQPVTYTEGMTLDDALKAAHEAYYSDGLSGYEAGTNNQWGIFLITKCWGVAQTPFIILNDTPAPGPKITTFVNATPVAENDNIIICTANTAGAATPKSLKATVSGDSVTLTATSWIFNSSTFTYTSAPLKNANVIDPITGAFLGITDDNGQLTITIPASGIVAIEGLAAINVNASST